MTTLIDLLDELIACPSITPNDAGCLDVIEPYLVRLGFKTTRYHQGKVSNLFACFGQGRPHVMFAGHTDVVSPGDLSLWHTPPFQLTIQDDVLFGRGVADMKGSLCAMLDMAKRYVNQSHTMTGQLSFLLTSGEEGDDYQDGTPVVMNALKAMNNLPDYCIVGEPSSHEHLGDVIKIGRRGSLSAEVEIEGIQGHVAYPLSAKNAIHITSPLLHALTTKEWDTGSEHFPPTSLQITHLHSGGHGGNVIPGKLGMHFNLRYNNLHTADSLKAAITELFDRHHLNPKIKWRHNGAPFLTTKGKLIEATRHAILKQLGLKARLETSGGTSDGRFIAPFGVEVVELGPVNATIHKANESVRLTELTALSQVYLGITTTLLAP